jgi:hypothetical protein
MFTPEERALLERFYPLIEAELRRIGVGADDERWIHAGSDQSPTEAMLSDYLAMLRSIPTGAGVVAYCARLGFDYETAKRAITS